MISEEQRDSLIAAAGRARERAYAPYSGYRVGAAVLADDGRIYTGVNVENASYGLTICAERAAVFNAVGAGAGRILAAAVCTGNRGSPCGACRQVLSEFGADMPIWLCDPAGGREETSLAALLPQAFGRDRLG
ncbi:MAG: cytidine deaminase [Candidatus Promineifilaceae bacterium]